MPPTVLRHLVLFGIAAAMTAADLRADDTESVDFAKLIQPLLVRRCVACHGGQKQESGLRLDSSLGIMTGGDGGAVVVPKDGKASRLMIAVSGGNDEVSSMPPKGERLSDSEIALLRRWIEQGAPVPPEDKFEATRSDHWSFQPPRRPVVTRVEDSTWTRNTVDAFVLARLAHAGIRPSTAAEPATLIRRVYLDLLGIPPAPAEVTAFESDSRPDAYERLVDRLLASPAYGERWGRHWLDAARYADSNGYTRDFSREIWKYRDWVIQAVNDDMPFDQFTIDQFAGDLLPQATLDQKIATGFHRNTLINEEGGTDQEQFRVDAVADRVATTGEVYLGLTLMCARCHSHKYDPISQREYYQIFAFLNNCDEPTIEAPSDFQVATGELDRREKIRQHIQQLEKQLESNRAELEKKQREWEASVTPQQRARLPGPVQVAYDMPFEKRDEANRKLIEDYYRQSEQGRQDFPILAEIASLRSTEPKIPKSMVMLEREEPRKTHIHRRGDFLDLGDEVTPAVPAVLPPIAPQPGEPYRLSFARWLVDPQNPLTARVITNRHWLHFFGRGLVETENDFGTQGSPPTHPDLLDWLAVEFVESGWSVKRLHRLIVTSAAYRQSSGSRENPARSLDPDNKLLWRQNRIRLDAEIIRDAALAVSGLLSSKIGGPSVFPPQPDGVFEFTQDPKPWPTATNNDRYRRGMYTHFWRSSPYPALMVFDAPNGNVTCTRRLRSNTPLQALTLANDAQFIECAQAMASRVLLEASGNDLERAEHAFRLGLARSPTDVERMRLAELVHQQRTAFREHASAEEAARLHPRAAEHDFEFAAWTAVCRVLLNLDEFITRE